MKFIFQDVKCMLQDVKYTFQDVKRILQDVQYKITVQIKKSKLCPERIGVLAQLGVVVSAVSRYLFSDEMGNFWFVRGSL